MGRLCLVTPEGLVVSVADDVPTPSKEVGTETTPEELWQVAAKAAEKASTKGKI
jgi:hypothetical protein